MSLIYGYDDQALSNASKANEVLQLAYEKLTLASLACVENDKINAEAIAKALSKASSASYKSRKVGEVADEALVLAKRSADRCDGSGNIQTFTTTMEFDQYGKQRIVKTFRTGIVLLGIVTKAIKDSTGYHHTGMAYYAFYDVTGSVHMAEIRSRQGNYDVINKDSDERVLNIQDVYTCLKRCTIAINLLGKDKASKPAKPVKRNITIQYIELSPNVVGNSGMAK